MYYYSSFLLWTALTSISCWREFPDSDGVEYDNVPSGEYGEESIISTRFPLNIRRFFFTVYNPSSKSIYLQNITYIETLDDKVIYEDCWYNFTAPPKNYSWYCFFKPRNITHPNITKEFGISIVYQNKTYYTEEGVRVNLTELEDDATTLILKMGKKELQIKTAHGRYYSGPLTEYCGPGLYTFTPVPRERWNSLPYMSVTHPIITKKTRPTTKRTQHPYALRSTRWPTYRIPISFRF